MQIIIIVQFSALDSPNYYQNRKNVAPDVVDIFVHHLELPVEDIVSLDKLNSDHNPVLFMIDLAGSDDAKHVSSYSMGYVQATSKADQTSFESYYVHRHIEVTNRNLLQHTEICKDCKTNE